ncbi:MAG: alkaline phosphatase [Tannerella sp.]|jgi:alkaline phosphatase|nr:alkaline phosphatase [Tannerella sp.]
MNNKYAKLLILFCFAVACFNLAQAQEIQIHSHNDYSREVPFYQAYAQHLSSIEADIHATETADELKVAHDAKDLPSAPTLDESYIRPLVDLYKQNAGRAWKNSDKTLVLLIDLKTPTNPTLDRLITKLKSYPEVFDPSVNPYAVRVVISGNTPDADTFDTYPSFIFFDGARTDYTPKQLERIYMISLNLRDYTQWNGKGRMIENEYQAVLQQIDAVHKLGKPIRFWGTPDGVTSWNTFYTIGADYINTDQPETCAAFFRNFHKKTFRINAEATTTDEVTRATRLDKATAGFQGFQGKELQLTHGIDIYEPAFRNDGKQKPVKNVILMIGDGMGLAQLCAADAVNEGLSILRLRYIGFQKTQAADSYTTDSAGAGSALATGKKHKNRHISMNPDGTPNPSMADYFSEKNYACGVVTLGNLADATPAVFYGHTTERDRSNEITSYLTDGKLTLLNGSGMSHFTNRKDGRDLFGELQSKTGYHFETAIEDINKASGKVICVDERMGKPTTEATLNLLADATREAIRKLTGERGAKGFFLMVEGAKIDYAGHTNLLPASILETFSFDQAVAEALRFADSNGETLVIVTGDHETGGLSLVDGNPQVKSITVQYTTDDHTPIMLPVFAYGPGAQIFTGVYENTDIFHRILKVAGIK